MDSYIAMALAIAKPLLISAVTIGALLGLLALIRPKAFAMMVAKGNYWVDTRKLLRIPDIKLFQVADKWIDTDRYTLRYSRLTGMVMLVGATLLGALYFAS